METLTINNNNLFIEQRKKELEQLREERRQLTKTIKQIKRGELTDSEESNDTEELEQKHAEISKKIDVKRHIYREFSPERKQKEKQKSIEWVKLHNKKYCEICKKNIAYRKFKMHLLTKIHAFNALKA